MTKNLLNCCFTVFVVFCAERGVWADWPEFRGPWGNGHVSAPGDSEKIGLALRWSETENVRWKTAIPHLGWSTPVVMDGKVWLTTATEGGNDFFVICVDAETGRILLNKKVFHADDPEPLSNDVNCYASPSPVIEPGCVYIHFGSYGTACLDTGSYAVTWERTDLPCRHYRGPGSSLVLFKDLLILTMDGVDVQYMAALDKRSGRTVWKTDRTAKWNDLDSDGKPNREGDFRKAYSTPLIVEIDGKVQMLAVAAKAAYGYDPTTGAELWKIHHAGYSNSSRPLFGHGLAYFNTGFPRPEIWAVRIGGEGETADNRIAWKRRQAVPQIPSALLIGDMLFTVSDTGAVTGLDAVTGEEIWKDSLDDRFASSPLYADGRIYCFSQKGQTMVLGAGRKYELLATNRLESGFMASPAVSGKAFFLRTKTHLYRIENR
jgi:outer membrane protein assembly factor BamB